MTSARRMARAGIAKHRASTGDEKLGQTVHGIPWELTTEGLESVLWRDDESVSAWLSSHGIRGPLPQFWGHPRALRDHAAHHWLRAHGYIDRWDRFDRRQLEGVPVPGIGARIRARFHQAETAP